MTDRSLARTLLILAALSLLGACDHYAAAQTGAAAPSLTPAPSPLELTEPDPCVAPAVGDTVAVAVPQRDDGSCAPLPEAFVYRCDPAAPAVAVLDEVRGARRFLGGGYAVPTVLPPDAVSLGVTAFGALYGDPTDDRTLWVQADGVTTRWLALPNPRKLGDPIAAQMIGDSILDGGQDDVLAGLSEWDATIDAEIGRGSYGAASIAETVASGGAAPDVVVIEIGVNDQDAGATAANAARIIDALGEAPLLVWLTAHGPQEPEVPAVNRAIGAAMAPLPNGAVLDWDRLVPLEALSSDGVHPDTGQQGVLASLLVPYLQTWHQAVIGDGPTGCEQAIRDAA